MFGRKPPYSNGLAALIVESPPTTQRRGPPTNALADLIVGRGPPVAGIGNMLARPPVAPPKPVFKELVIDGVRYSFRVLPIRARPWQRNCVYAFMRAGLPVYVGKAITAYSRFGVEHDRRAEALRLGADELWVTEVRRESAFGLDEAEQRMIAAYCPILNDKHNPLSRYR